ncbi:hypothetical protein EDB81DRAFT_872488 [Dactylonectria macrodidyma]|uniref:Uncharacterized protein n=1 Tax=Dactylonectria macrodidyma TaxID=307937 RepID=A0A9P9DSB8_9HYPO|nr:hypothetical protein EDB81DRAFT_872488 [Dactylonectria macrodidyma]
MISYLIHLPLPWYVLKAYDALALKEAFPGDLIAYLSKTFMHPVTLMSAMFDSGCVISGSRALEFFIPGSIILQSDWDFYVPGYKESVADMINVLALCGVTWDLEGDAIVSALTQSGTVEVAVRTMEALVSWMSQLDAAIATTLMGESLYQVLSAFLRSTRSSCDKSYTVSIDLDNQVVVTPNQFLLDERPVDSATYKDSAGQSFNLLRGSIMISTGTQPVQLIVGYHYSGQRPEMSAAIKTAIVKYQKRGFEFFPAPKTSPTLRRLKDSRGMFLDYGDIYQQFIRSSNQSLLQKWLTERRQNIDSIQWTEFQGEILSMYSPMEACWKRSKSYAVAAYGLPLDRLRRLADIISLNTPSTDAMRTELFFSTVRKTVMGDEWYSREAARSGAVYFIFRDATPWSWLM